MLKIVAASAMLTVAMLVGLPAPQAQARVNLDVGVVLGDEGYGYQEIYDARDPRYDDSRRPRYDDPRNPRYDDGRGPRYDDPRHPRYDRRPEERRPYDEGLSCKEGRKMVSRQGFHSVEVLDCEGRTYTYKARRDGDGRRFIVRINRRGEIIRVERD